MHMKRVWYIGGGVVALAILGVAYYGISPFFINIRADDAAPLAPSGAGRAPAPIIDTPAHPASGTVRIIEADGAHFVRYENFKTINGPDLYVYLAKDLSATEFIDLGRLRATEGNVNYEIPSGVNIDDYPYVLTWCKAFGVLFNSARITAS